MTRIWKDELLKVMQLYQRELSEFIYRPMSPAMLERMKFKLESCRQYYRRQEQNPIWDIRVEIVQVNPHSFELHPILEGVTLEEKPKVPF